HAAGTDANLEFAIASLGDWLPHASGSLRGAFSARGAWPKLDLDGRLDGQKLAFESAHIDTLALSVAAHDLSAPSGTLGLTAQRVAASGYAFERVGLDAKGDAGAHQLHLAASGSPLNLEAALSGALRAGDWRGTLATLTLAVKDQPTWKLADPAGLRYAD